MDQTNRIEQPNDKPHTNPTKALHQPNYSLSPNPSPNGEGSENHCLQVKESLTPSPNQRSLTEGK